MSMRNSGEVKLTLPQEIAGHKLSDAVIQRLPTLTTISPGGKISYSEVSAFYNVIRGAHLHCKSESRIHTQ